MTRPLWFPLLVLGAVGACGRPAAREAPGAWDGIRVRVEPLAVSPARYSWTAAQRDSAVATLEHHRRVWAATRPRHYRYREHAWCFCATTWAGPRVVTVHDGRVVSATDTTGRFTDSAYVHAAARRPAGGIDALFDRVAAGTRDTAYAEVRAEYDATRGHPSRVTFDRELLASDDEYHVDVSRVEALP
jgi:hypothetical protein